MMIFEICTTTLNNIQVTESRMKWARFVEHVGKEINTYRILVRKPEERHHLEDLSVDERIVFKCLRLAGCCKNGNE